MMFYNHIMTVKPIQLKGNNLINDSWKLFQQEQDSTRYENHAILTAACKKKL